MDVTVRSVGGDAVSVGPDFADDVSVGLELVVEVNVRAGRRVKVQVSVGVDAATKLEGGVVVVGKIGLGKCAKLKHRHHVNLDGTGHADLVVQRRLGGGYQRDVPALRIQPRKRTGWDLGPVREGRDAVIIFRGRSQCV